MPLCGSRATLATNDTGLAAAGLVITSSSPFRSGVPRRPEIRSGPTSAPDSGWPARPRWAAQRIAGKRRRLRPGRLVGPDVAGERSGQRRAVAAVDRLAIGDGAAIEHARQLLHALRHAEIADAELADRMLDVGEERVGELLRDVARRRPPRRAAGAGPGTRAAPSSRSGRAACPEHSSRHKAPAAAPPPRFVRRGASVIFRLAARAGCRRMRLNMPEGSFEVVMPGENAAPARLHRRTSWFTGFAPRRKPSPGRD